MLTRGTEHRYTPAWGDTLVDKILFDL